MLQYFKYHLPFRSPFKTSGTEFTHREGIILVYKEGDVEAYGEAAPLPGFSDESLAEVEEVLKMNREHLQKSIQSGEGKDTLRLLDHIHGFPSLSFGIDTLLHDLAAKREGKSLVEYLFSDYNPTVSCNATLPILGEKETLSAARNFIEQGFHTLKVKVGRDFEHEKKILQSLRSQFPSIKLRIDANQAWTKEQAIKNLDKLDSLEIEYCEQPVSKDQHASLKAVKEAVNIPIAADESVRNKNSALELSENNVASLFILKPMLMGTFDNIFVTNRVANTHNIETVFTTSLESTVGRAAIVALASGLGSRKRAHGLATGSMFNKDISSENWLNKSKITFPDFSGLGISLHLEGLKEL